MQLATVTLSALHAQQVLYSLVLVQPLLVNAQSAQLVHSLLQVHLLAVLAHMVHSHSHHLNQVQLHASSAQQVSSATLTLTVTMVKLFACHVQQVPTLLVKVATTLSTPLQTTTTLETLLQLKTLASHVQLVPLQLPQVQHNACHAHNPPMLTFWVLLNASLAQVTLSTLNSVQPTSTTAAAHAQLVIPTMHKIPLVFQSQTAVLHVQQVLSGSLIAHHANHVLLELIIHA